MDHNSIGYFLHGTGDTKVIALHSWMDDAQSWNATIPFLNPEKYTYAFMDVRGYGASKDIPGQYNLEEIKDDIFQLANVLGFPTFHLIGHSMCGMAAQYAAFADKENRIKKVALLTPVASSGFPADEETKGFLKALIQNVDIAKMGYGAFTSNRYADYWYKMRAERHIQVTDEKAQHAYMQMWLTEDFRNKMLSVEKPFLVLAGTYDHPQFQMPIQKKNFEGFRQVDFIECENSGHFPMQEAPVFLASTIEAFLS